jgi:hypothetical protein
MRNLFHKILSALNFKGRDWVVFLLALLLAFSIWMIHNLSLKYNDYFSVSVIAECNIPGHAGLSSNKCEVTARCRATGYKLIKAHIGRGRSHRVEFKSSDMVHYEGDLYYVTSSDLQGYSHLMFGPGVSVDYFLSDTLFFRFPYENYKKVKVVPISVVSYEDQYMADGEVSVVPDSVFVYGEPYMLESVDKVFTRPITYNSLSEDVMGLVGLEKIKGVRCSVDEVKYSLQVKRFVEIAMSLPVRVKNVPNDKILRVYPSDAMVRVRCNFPLSEDPMNGLTLEADYNDYSRSLSGKCMLNLSGLSRSVINYSIEPEYVSGVVEDIR